jgi:NTE family protein
MTINQDITLVCGGGGVWGVAWMTGVVMGLADKGLNIRTAGTMIGSSAGSVISTQLTSEWSTEALFERQIDPAKQPAEVAPPPEGLALLTQLMMRPWDTDELRLRAISDLARRAKTMSPEERRRMVVDRIGLGEAAWPKQRLMITGIDMDSLELVAFEAASGVPLIDAVGASCAVPGVYPPRPIGAQHYIDGGLWRTAENAHLAQGAKAVLILSPMGRAAGGGLGVSAGLAADITALEAQGTKVALIAADGPSLAAMAPSPLDPITRAPAAEAGRAQGQREVDVARAVFEMA